MDLEEIAPPDAASIEPGVLLFAGEALSSLDQQQVHGAMESGEEAAKKVLQRFNQQTGANRQWSTSQHAAVRVKMEE